MTTATARRPSLPSAARSLQNAVNGSNQGSGSRRLGDPKPATVEADSRGTPAAVGSVAVDTLREEWVVEDRWWTGRPLRRRYFELVLVDGRNVVVFRDLVGGGWFLQRA
jgi:hypothetical protein